MKSIVAEGQALLAITVPVSSGYEVRNLILTQGTFDLSISRFSVYFTMLAGPIMLICAILAAFILLGNKD